METFTFDLIAEGEHELTFELSDQFLQSIHDASQGTCEGVLSLSFDRESISAEEAILSAISELERVPGIRIDRVESISEINPELVKSINSLLGLRNTTTREHALEMWSKVC